MKYRIKRLKTAGMHDGVPMESYVADPCPEPSVSKGVVHDIVTRSPRHAFMNHPRLGADSGEGSVRADLGSAVHAFVLGGEEAIVWVDADDFRTKAARQARDEARESGKIPLLRKMEEPVKKASASAMAKLDGYGAGKREQTMVWQDEGAWCRARPDWISLDHDLVIDLKTTTNADPTSWIKSSLFSGGYDIQAAHYLRGLDILFGEQQRDFYFLLAEIEPPFACSLVALGPEALELAQRKVRAGLRVWRECIASGDWPGYSDAIHWADLPAYMQFDWEARAIAYAA